MRFNWRQGFGSPQAPRSLISCIALVLAAAGMSSIASDQVALSFPPAIQGTVGSLNNSLTIDTNGNRYVVGNFGSTLDFNPRTGEDSKTSAGGTDVFVTRYNADGSYAWTQTFGGTGTDTANGVVTSDDGLMVYVTGSTGSSTVRIGGAGPAISTAGGGDLFVIALNAASGAAITSFGRSSSGIQTFGGTGFDSGQAITFNSSILYVVGQFDSAGAQIGAGGMAISSAGATDAMIIALDASTGLAKAGFGRGGSGIETFGGGSAEVAQCVICNGSTVYFAGSFLSSNAALGTSTSFVSASSGQDAFVVALDALTGTASPTFIGSVVGVQTIGGSGDETATGLGLSGPLLYVSGYFTGNIAVTGGSTFSTTAGGTDGFVLALMSSEGTPLNSFGPSANGIQTFGGAGEDRLHGMAVLESDSVYAYGDFNSASAKIGGSGPAVGSVNTQNDAVVIRLDHSNGSALTAFGKASSGIQTFGGSNADTGRGIALGSNFVYLAGVAFGSDIGVGGSGAINLTGYSSFLVPLDLSTGRFGLPPTDVALSSNSIQEGNAVGATIGTFTTTDPDVGDTFTYAFAAGTGSTDNASFSLASDTLKAAQVFTFATKSSYSIRIRTSDQTGQSFEKVFVIEITQGPNSAPTNIALSPATIQEGNAVGANIGTLSTTDPDAGNTFTYTLVTGAGSADNASFTITGATLKANAVFVFATKSSYSIRVRTTDQGGLFFEKALTVTITPTPNAAPTDIALNPASIHEGNALGENIGAFSTTDPDAGNTFTYSLVTGAGGADNASFTISGAILQANAVFMFATKSSYSIRVRSTDQGGLIFEKALTVSITQSPPQPNSAPTDIALSNSSFPDTLPLGGKIGSFTTSDPDVGNSFTYALVSGAGGDDNALFAINADALATAAALDFNIKNAFTIRIRSTDAGGLFVEKSFALNLTTQPNSGASGVPNVSNTTEGIDTVTNPVDGLTIKVSSSDGGLIQLAVDVNALRSRAGINLITEFGDIPGRSSQASGPLPVHKFGARGIFIARSTASDALTGASIGKGRKTLVISAKETGEVVGGGRDARGAPRTLGDPPSNAISTRMIKGKFVFGASKSDSVTFGGTIQLPPNLNPKIAHEFSIAIGNIVVDLSVDAKGKGSALTNSEVLKSLKITYKVKKGKLAAGGELATISAVLSAKGLVEAGFDTEGINSKSKDVAPGKSGARSIQIGMLLDGIPYQSSAPVTFSLSKDSEFANIQSRN